MYSQIPVLSGEISWKERELVFIQENIFYFFVTNSEFVVSL